MKKLIQIIAFLSVLLTVQPLAAQFTTIYESDTLLSAWYTKPIGQFGNNKLLTLQDLNGNRKRIQTDGTMAGTKELGFTSFNETYLQVNADTCIRVVYEDNHTIVQIFTASQDAASDFIINNFNYTEAKQINNQLILKASDSFVFFNLSTGTYLKKEYNQLTWYAKWFLTSKYIIFAPVNYRIYKISLTDHAITTISETGTNYIAELIPYNDSSFLYIADQKLYALNIEAKTTEFLRDLPYYSEGYSSPSLVLDSAINFAYFSSSTYYHVINSNGTKDGTIELKTGQISPFLNQLPLFTLQNKLFFVAGDTLWQSDGTIPGTNNVFDKKVFNYFYSKGPANGKYFFLSLDSQNIMQPYVFDGTTRFQIKSNNKDEANYATSYYTRELIGKKNAYLPLVDINFGRELHQFNFETKETKLVHDFTQGLGWSNIYPIAEINNRIISIINKGNKAFLVSFDESQPIIKKPAPPKKYDWAESFTSASNFSKNNGATDSKGNYYISVATTTSRPAHLVYNRKNLGALNTNKIVKFSKTGEFISSLELPAQGNRPALLAVNESDELVLGFVLGTTFDIDGKSFKASEGNLLLITLDANNHLKWSKQFQIGIQGHPDEMVIKNHQIFLSGKYSGKMAQFDQHTLHSERNIATFLTNISTDGDVLWANAYPLATIWPIDKGISAITTGPRQVYMMQRIGNKQERLTCTGNKYRFKIFAISQATGKTTWERTFVNKDFAFPIDFAASSKEQLTIIGSYMDEIEFDNILLPSDSCNQTNFFQLTIDPYGQIIKASRQDSDYQFLTQVEYDTEDNLFLLGVKVDSSFFSTYNSLDTNLLFSPKPRFSHKLIAISKYNQVGQLIQTKKLHQNTNYQDFYGFKANLQPEICFSPHNHLILSCLPNYILDSFNIMYDAVQNSFTDLFLLQFDMQNSHDMSFDGEINTLDIFLAPNPAQNYLNITSTDIDFSEASLTIFAMDGKQWQLPRQQNHGTVKFNISSLPQGTYVVAIRLRDQVLAQKFVKM